MADRAQVLEREAFFALAAGNHVIVGGSPDYVINVVGFILSADAAVFVTWQDGTASLLDVNLGQDVPFATPEMAGGWLSTHEGDDLTLSVGAGGNVGGIVVYRLVPEHQRY